MARDLTFEPHGSSWEMGLPQGTACCGEAMGHGPGGAGGRTCDVRRMGRRLLMSQQRLCAATATHGSRAGPNWSVELT